MTLVRHTFKITNYTLVALGVLFALITLWMWLQAILWWGDTYAFAEAFTWTFLTLVVFVANAGVEYVRNRGD